MANKPPDWLRHFDADLFEVLEQRAVVDVDDHASMCTDSNVGNGDVGCGGGVMVGLRRAASLSCRALTMPGLGLMHARLCLAKRNDDGCADRVQN